MSKEFRLYQKRLIATAFMRQIPYANTRTLLYIAYICPTFTVQRFRQSRNQGLCCTFWPLTLTHSRRLTLEIQHYYGTLFVRYDKIFTCRGQNIIKQKGTKRNYHKLCCGMLSVSNVRQILYISSDWPREGQWCAYKGRGGGQWSLVTHTQLQRPAGGLPDRGIFRYQ